MVSSSQFSFNSLPEGAEENAAEMVRQAFLKQVAPHFSAEGSAEFLKSAGPQAIAKRLAEGNFMLAASDAAGLAGIIEINSARGHIVWFFVRPEVQSSGLGRELLRRGLAELRQRRPDLTRVTVNSSPNAVDAYLSLGFVPTGLQQEKQSIRFTPMSYNLS